MYADDHCIILPEVCGCEAHSASGNHTGNHTNKSAILILRFSGALISMVLLFSSEFNVFVKF